MQAANRAIAAALALLLGACAHNAPQPREAWAAHGYLRPDPTGASELIGVFDTVEECRAAADDWASRQVVGNPVFADCYPVDQN